MIELDEASVVIDDVTLLAPTSVAVGPGNALIVRGENGAGKSTLLRIVTGMRTPSSGSVRIAGKPVADRDRGFRRRVAAMRARAHGTCNEVSARALIGADPAVRARARACEALRCACA